MSLFKKRNIVFSIIAFFVILIASFILVQKYTTSTTTIKLSKEQVIQEAKALFQSIVDTRSWNAKHGGVYVKQTENIKPNPYLKDNIMYSDKNEPYVKINPAWMTRQISEISNKKGAYHYKITSLNPINPNNKADEFEKEALNSFEKNKKETYYYKFNNSNDTFNFMGALITEKSCLNCHAFQGYKLGDIRGGIRVSLPTKLYHEKITLIKDETQKSYYIIIFATIGALGVLYWVINLFYKRQYEIEHANEILETKVSQRTKELKSAVTNEQHLKDVLKIVAEVNELLITNTDENTILKTITHKLSKNKFYSFVETVLYDNTNIDIIAQSSENKIKDFDYNQTIDMASKALHPITKQVYLNNTPEKQWLIVLPLINLFNNKIYGIISIVSSKYDGFRIEEINILENLTQDISMGIYSHKQSNEILKMEKEKSSNYEETILAFVNMIEKRDSYTAGHTIRVAKYSSMIAKDMNFSDEEIRRLEKAAILHDIGKIATPDTILLKPGKLTNLEYELIKQHSKVGYEMLHKISIYKDLAEIIKYHHSRYDGKGYPETNSPDEIPMLTHIMIVADAFDAMTTNRIYRPRKSIQYALEEIEFESGRQFHPDVAKTAIKVLKNIEIEDTSQLPQSDLEKKRMSYFFLDSLTELYNEDYLNIILSQNNEYKYLNIVKLHNFTEYNHKYGWNNGNKLIKSIAILLKKEYSNCIIARYHGDDFVLIDKTKFIVDKQEIENSGLFDINILKIEIIDHLISEDFSYENLNEL